MQGVADDWAQVEKRLHETILNIQYFSWVSIHSK